MTAEEKWLLLQDLCARLPYGMKGKVETSDGNGEEIKDEGVLNSVFIDELGAIYICVDGVEYELEDVKPYLRPLSSMTEEERGELRKILCLDFAPKDCPQFEPDFSVRTFYSCNEQEQDEYYDMETMLSYFKFLNSHHFDYRGLIGMGLALEAPEGMYNFK